MGLGRAGSAGVFGLRTLDAEDPDRSDLEPLRGIVGDARVVCLGEGAHVTHEFLLARFLVDELGVTSLVLESGYAEGLALDRWVGGGPGELSVHAVGHGLGDNEPTRTQLAWLRAHGGVRVFGMDLPGSGTDPGPAVRECLDRLAPRAGDDEMREPAALGCRGPAPARSRAPTGVLAARAWSLTG